MKIIVLIPARGGSKSIPRKNIKSYIGKPLIAHSIELAKQCDLIDDIIVSTDDTEIAAISRKYEAHVPFLRPSEYAQDLSTDLDVFTHYLEWCDNKPDIIVHLRPTYPNRTKELLERCINLFVTNYDKYDSLRTVCKVDKSPYKMYRNIDNNLIPLFFDVDGIDEPYNACRQILPQCYLHNGCIDIVKSTTIQKGSMSGKRILPVIMNENYDIDTLKDFSNSEQYYSDSDSVSEESLDTSS